MTAKRRQTSERDSKLNAGAKETEREGEKERAKQQRIHDILLAFMDGSVKLPSPAHRLAKFDALHKLKKKMINCPLPLTPGCPSVCLPICLSISGLFCLSVEIVVFFLKEQI